MRISSIDSWPLLRVLSQSRQLWTPTSSCQAGKQFEHSPRKLPRLDGPSLTGIRTGKIAELYHSNPDFKVGQLPFFANSWPVAAWKVIAAEPPDGESVSQRPSFCAHSSELMSRRTGSPRLAFPHLPPMLHCTDPVEFCSFIIDQLSVTGLTSALLAGRRTQ